MPNKYVNKLAGQRALIVGGTSGIGFSVAENALEHGATVIVASSKPSSVDQAVKRLTAAYPDSENQVQGYTVDLMADNAEDQIVDLLKRSTDSGKKLLDHIILSAGGSPSFINVPDFQPDMLRDSQHLRMVVPLLFAKHAPGHYLRVSNRSSLTFTGGSNIIKQNSVLFAGYRGAVAGTTQSLAVDLRPIRVNHVLPSATETELWKWMSADDMQAFKESLKHNMLTGEIAQPEDISEVYLSIMKNTNVTGQSLYSDGGVLLAPGIKA